MKVSRVRIHNFRSVADLEIEVLPHMVILGPNNHGKSNVLRAMEFAFGASKVDDSDFSRHLPGDNHLWVDLTFSDLTEQESVTFGKYLENGRVTIRRGARLFNGKIDIYYAGRVMLPRELWLRPDKENVKAVQASYEDTPLRAYLSGKPTQEAVKQAQTKYIEDNSEIVEFVEEYEEPFMGQKTVAAGVLPEFFLIPAVRDLSQESQLKGTALLGKLMQRAIAEMAQSDERYRRVRAELAALVSTFNKGSPGRPKPLEDLEQALDSELQSWGVKVEIEVAPPQIEKLFEIGTGLLIDDGLRTLAENKGHGLQRAALFALIKAWARSLTADKGDQDIAAYPRAASASVVFAIEEPELFLHPHAQRQMAEDLHRISDASGHQVLLCSHSANFIDMKRYKEIVLISKAAANSPSERRQCLDDLFSGPDGPSFKSRFNMAHWINPERGEMFFARRVVFVEGATEAVTLPYAAEMLNLKFRDVSIIDTGSKFNIPLYVQIAKAFDLDYVVIHDEDPLPSVVPDAWGEDRLRAAKKTFSMNQKILDAVGDQGRVMMLKPDFEGAVGFSRTRAEKVGKPLAAIEQLDHFSRDGMLPDTIRVAAEFAFS